MNCLNYIFIIIVMSQEVVEYFNRFYNILLRQHLHDPTIHSEWLYFLSMFKSEPLDQGRIDLYLNILVSENKKKVEYKQKDGIVSLGSQNKQKNRCNRQSSVSINELKIQKKMSENIKNPYSLNFEFKATPQVLQIKKNSSADQDLLRMQRQSLNSDSKNSKDKHKEQPFYGIQLTPSSNINQYLANLGLNYLTSEKKQEKQLKTVKQSKLLERNKKLIQISNRLVREFQANAKLRA